MRRSISAHQRAKDLMAMYERDCEPLLLKSVEEKGVLGRYLLMPPSGFLMWAEVVVLRAGCLLVHGDVDTVVFSNFYKPKTPRDVLEWMGSKDTCYTYAEEKASIGGSIARCFDEYVALRRVLEYRRNGTLDREQARQLKELLDDGTSQQEFSTRMYELTRDPELCSLGTVTDQRVFMALAVIKRLLKLLPDHDNARMRERSSFWLQDTDSEPPSL
jgi:hypothetical protein